MCRGSDTAGVVFISGFHARSSRPFPRLHRLRSGCGWPRAPTRTKRDLVHKKNRRAASSKRGAGSRETRPVPWRAAKSHASRTIGVRRASHCGTDSLKGRGRQCGRGCSRACACRGTVRACSHGRVLFYADPRKSPPLWRVCRAIATSVAPRGRPPFLFLTYTERPPQERHVEVLCAHPLFLRISLSLFSLSLCIQTRPLDTSGFPATCRHCARAAR